MNFELKLALMRQFGTQIAASRAMGIKEGRLSYIVRGHVEPSDKERKALERGLGPVVVKKLLKKREQPVDQAATG